MQGFNIAEQGHVCMPVAPVDLTGGKTGARFSMKNWAHASILIMVGVSAAAWTKIIVNAATLASAGTTTAIPYRLYAMETTAGDVLSAAEAVLAAWRTPSAVDAIFYCIELDARELPDGSPWVEVSLTNGANSVIGAVVAILSGGRFTGAAQATVLS
jgi:hypothetical protein